MIRKLFFCGLAALFIGLAGCAGSKDGAAAGGGESKPSAVEERKALEEAKADAETAEKKLHELRVEKARLEAEKQK